MPLYEYACRTCGHSEDRLQRDLSITCPDCSSPLYRQWGFNTAESFQPHFNHAVGQFVSSKQEFKDALSRGGDSHNTTYSMVEAGDMPRTEHGMEETAKFKRDAGITDSPTKVMF